MKNRLMLLFFAGWGSMMLHAATVERSATIINGTSQQLQNFPVILSAAGWNLPDACDFDRIEIRDDLGKIIPAQFDDLNKNQKCDAEDQIALLPNLKPGENIFSLQFLPGGGIPEPESAEVGTEFLSLDNGIIKLQVHKQKMQLFNIYHRVENEWKSVASHYSMSLKIDQHWNWKTSSPIMTLIASGPVQKVLQIDFTGVHSDTGKTFLARHQFHLFAGRSEILYDFSFRNSSRDQMLQLSSVNKGFYNVTPGGNVLSPNDKFASLDRDGKILTDDLKNGGYYVRRAQHRKSVWVDAFNEEANLGFGYAYKSTPDLETVLLQYIEKNGRTRMSDLYSPPDVVLWPEQKVSYQQWYVAHRGDYHAVEQFATQMDQITAP
jgi:hypothetical protein